MCMGETKVEYKAREGSLDRWVYVIYTPCTEGGSADKVQWFTWFKVASQNCPASQYTWAYVA